MKILESAENYLEAILIIKNEKGQVRAIDIVNYLNFSKPSVSIAMKQLEANGFIKRNEEGHIFLTEDGLEIAETIYERHRVLTEMFMKLGVSETAAKNDACKIEHHISEESFAAIKGHLKNFK
ncbi:MAG: metal-dependent transcriptional regulator [Clostridiales bacterium]|nr:metal-dependent transcriptional regulator [Clostridiales bacterium]